MQTEPRNSCSLLGVIGVLLLMSLALYSSPTSATIVWTDAFDDGNFDGWTVTYGAFSCAENALLAIQYSSTIHYPSTVMVGTWSFDLFVVDSGTSCLHVCFYCESFAIYPITGMDLKVSRNGFELMYWLDAYDDSIGEYFPPFVMTGWQHIDITRDDTGLIRVYINDSLRIETVDNRIPSSSYFYLLTNQGEGIDNIVVSDSVDITPPPGPQPGNFIELLAPYLPLIILGLTLIAVISVGTLFRRRLANSQ